MAFGEYGASARQWHDHDDGWDLATALNSFSFRAGIEPSFLGGGLSEFDSDRVSLVGDDHDGVLGASGPPAALASMTAIALRLALNRWSRASAPGFRIAISDGTSGLAKPLTVPNRSGPGRTSRFVVALHSGISLPDQRCRQLEIEHHRTVLPGLYYCMGSLVRAAGRRLRQWGRRPAERRTDADEPAEPRLS